MLNKGTKREMWSYLLSIAAIPNTLHPTAILLRFIAIGDL